MQIKINNLNVQINSFRDAKDFLKHHEFDTVPKELQDEFLCLADKNGWSIAHFLAHEKRLPIGFSKWDLADKNGTTVAHVEASFAPMPEGFVMWNLADENGLTVAEVARWRGWLPKDISLGEYGLKWHVDRIVKTYEAKRQYVGKTSSFSIEARGEKIEINSYFDATHFAYSHGVNAVPEQVMVDFVSLKHPEFNNIVGFYLAAHDMLPENFKHYEVANETGMTIAHFAGMHGHLPKNFKDWHLARYTDGITVAHLAVEHGPLPQTFTQYELADNNGIAVAHLAAMYGHLPKNFNWEKYGHIKDCHGESVLDVAIEHGHAPNLKSQKSNQIPKI